MTLFKNKYRIESNRKPGWDYSGNGFYYITIVTQDREHLFGKIENNKMILSDFGKIAEYEWNNSFKIRKELFLDEYVLMPNHLHAIVVIKKLGGFGVLHGLHGPYGLYGSYGTHVEAHGRASLPEQPNNPEQPDHPNKPIQTNQPNEPNPHDTQPKFYRKPKSISSFVGGFKTAVIIKIDDFIDFHKLPIEKYNHENKLWQPNYHDRIIHNNEEYWQIKNYIKNNPQNWTDDELFK